MTRYKTVSAGFILIAIIFAAACFFCARERSVTAEEILASFDKNAVHARISISYPQDATLFPPEIIAPIFKWQDSSAASDRWLVHLDFNDGLAAMNIFVNAAEWQPRDEEWETIKARSLARLAHVSLFGLNSGDLRHILSAADFSFATSPDSVAAPIFYREVNLPFESAVKDPTKILWRFGCISEKAQPPVVLANMPVCGNCHSFSLQGHKIGLDVDYANDKGSYAFTDVQKQISLSEANIITWSDYKRQDNVTTFGLLSQVSPDGRYVVSTVKDRSVFVAKPELYFSQLFFPIRGILAYYDSATGEFHSLAGADNARYVQSNASWSPDGKYIVFARREAYKLKNLYDNERVLLTAEECEEFLQGNEEFRYDLYRIPFNQGKGGMPEPLKGASFNGMSNFFAKYSPDGKWIVFCRAKSYMLLQPDSKLYIIPAEGGEARRLSCNTARMNSWHSWSPSSRWLVFASKQNSAYTQLFLTHIDGEGVSSPPVLLRQFTSANMAANIPEFVNAAPAAIETIQKNFLTDLSYLRAGNEALLSKDYALAEQKYNKALQINEKNIEAMIQLAIVLAAQKRLDEAETCCRKAIQLDSSNAKACFQLGDVLCSKGDLAAGIDYLSIAAKLDAKFPTTHFVLGQAKERLGRADEAIDHYKDFLRLYPTSFKGYFCLLELLLQQGDIDQAVRYANKAESLTTDNASFLLGNLFTKHDQLDHANRFYANAIKADPDNAEPMCNLAANLYKQGEHRKAINWYEEALDLKEDVLPGLIGLSSILVTTPDASLRNGRRAVQLMERACQLTNYEADVPLSLLAAAHAECGDFAKAIDIAGRALGLAQAKGKDDLAQQLKGQIEIYERALLQP
ncbi:tetratricopeptide repeat protein [candidate division KSB1 bacterium]|nr:tetratricopeptide repeat protein [candidate division KSB1 bacterium]